ncbi:MAG: nuclease-related domain-containing protein, partial [Opitutaceae bacterium]
KGLGLKGGATLGALIAAFIAFTAVSVIRVARLWRNRTNNFLGWYGERIVADKLRPLQFSGYRIFHDLPCESGTKGFNIDHVVVGPTGIAIIEVKARRKFDGPHGHEITFDGSKVIGPWGAFRKPVDQTLNQAEWLEKWIFDKVGFRVLVRPVLTFPGWHISESPGPIRVVPTDFLCDAIKGRGEVVLGSTQIEQISRWLDERCRDVAD